jgi:hypothetical protein
MLQTSAEIEVLFANAREFVDYIGDKYRGNKALGMPVSETIWMSIYGILMMMLEGMPRLLRIILQKY